MSYRTSQEPRNRDSRSGERFDFAGENEIWNHLIERL